MPTIPRKPEPKPVMPIAPMIDCVFLMLIYFMVTSSLERQEADIAFQLPGVAETSEPMELPDEQIIEIDPSGQVIVNQYAYDKPADRRFAQLTAMLTRFKQASDASKVECMVTIAPADGTPHQMIVKVMDAISAARIDSVNFALSSEE